MSDDHFHAAETLGVHANTADQKGYLDAVVSAGQRSRAIVYFVLILIVLTLTTMRNAYSPDWMSVRSGAYQDLLRCLKVHDVSKGECKELTERAKRAGLGATNKDLPASIREALGLEVKGDFTDPDFLERNKLVMEEIELKIKKFLEKEIETYIIKIPLLGSTVDINDLWLVSGVVMFFLLYFLKASLIQEYLNISYIIENKPELGNMVVLNQVVTISASHANRLVTLFQRLVALVPTFLYLYLFYTDFMTRNIEHFLLDRWYFIQGNILVEAVTIALVVYMNFGCLLHHLQIQKMISALREKLGESNSRRVANALVP
jgi:hypothetical protein